LYEEIKEMISTKKKTTREPSFMFTDYLLKEETDYNGDGDIYAKALMDFENSPKTEWDKENFMICQEDPEKCVNVMRERKRKREPKYKKPTKKECNVNIIN
jgi:hypothetical protein